MLSPTDLLLRACFDATALDALHQWETAVDIEAHDADAHSLLPLLKYNADARGWTLLHGGRIGGVYRRWWTSNMLALRSLTHALDLLQTAQVEVMVIDDAALALTAYARPALRPLDRLTLLIRPEQHHKAYQALQAGGWKASHWIPSRRRPYTESLSFSDAHQIPLIVRWFAADRRCAPGIDADLWARMICHTDAQGNTIPVISASDQLVLSASRLPTAWHSPCPSLRVADALTLIQNCPMDWSQVVASAICYRLTLPLYHLLALLSLPDPATVIPDDVMISLSATPTSWMLRAENGALQRRRDLPAWQAHLIRWWLASEGLRHVSQGVRYLWRWFDLPPIPRLRKQSA